MRTAFQDVPCAVAEELMNHLMPHHGRTLWDRRDQASWIFRGQSDAAWALVPSAHRVTPTAPLGSPFKKFIPGQITMPSYSIDEVREMEWSFALTFADGLSKRGIEVPFDTPTLRDHDRARERAPGGAHFPPPATRGIFALAQHYGIPTRLLDWTRRPLMGAYFAARGAAQAYRDANGAAGADRRLAVWALSTSFLEVIRALWDPGPVIVTAPKASNPNLRAQDGLFTLVRYANASPGLPPIIDELFANGSLPTGDYAPMPVLFKFTLPHAEAGRLLHFLQLHNVDASAIYAGHGAIVDAMSEAELRTITRPGGRTDSLP